MNADMNRLQALLLNGKPSAKDQPDDRQGRDCKRPPVSDGVELALTVAAYAVTLLAAVAGLVHLAARAGWL